MLWIVRGLLFYNILMLNVVAPSVENGDTIASEGKGEYMWVEGKVMDTKGNPIANCTIDTWETDFNGLYDTQVRQSSIPI